MTHDALGTYEGILLVIIFDTPQTKFILLSQRSYILRIHIIVYIL